MGHFKIADKLGIILCAGVMSLLPIGAGVAFAQSIPAKVKAPAENPAKKKEEAQRLVAAGVKAYESGKLDNAVESLSAGMRAGGLPSQQMAKALYVRGLAYRKQGKPALAISDLTSAVWLKGGLSETERSDAMENRVAAYREAGLGEGVAVPKARTSSGPQTAAATATPAAAPEAKPSGWQTATIGSTSTVTPAPSAAPALGLASTDQSETPSPASTSSSTGIGTSVSNFFGNMFGSTPSSANAAPSPAAGEAPKPAEQKVAAASTASWGDATRVSPTAVRTPRGTDAAPAAPAAAPPVRQAAIQPAPAPAPAAPAAATGKYQLQVAAVRSRPDAEAVAARLKKEHSFRLDAREPVIDEAVYGNMGTFYRVRVGPYADASEPKQLCSAIKSGGFDCMVVTK